MVCAAGSGALDGARPVERVRTLGGMQATVELAAALAAR